MVATCTPNHGPGNVPGGSTMDRRFSSPAEKLKDRFKGLKNPLQQLRRDSLTGSSGSPPPLPPGSPVGGATSWQGVARELTFSAEELTGPAVAKESEAFLFA